MVVVVGLPGVDGSMLNVNTAHLSVRYSTTTIFNIYKLDCKVGGFFKGRLSIGHDKLSAFQPQLDDIGTSADDILR